MAYLVLGGSLGSSTTIDLADADYLFVGENDYDQAGLSVDGAGDVDGDGLDDILVGAPGSDDGGSNAGKTYIILAASLGSTTTIDLADADHALVGASEDDASGRSVASAGDVDGDGLADVLIGAPYYGSTSYIGRAHLVLGASLEGSSSIDLSLADFTFTGEDGDNQAGWSVAGADDVNGDGLDDLFIGAYGNDDGGTDAGKAYLLLSSNSCNTPPEAAEISIDPEDPMEGIDDLLCLIDTTSTDADGDTVTYTFEWDVDGVAYTGASSTYETGDTVPAADTFEEEVWTCTVTPNDGTEDGSSATTSVTVTEADCFDGWPSADVELADSDYQLFGEDNDDQSGFAVSDAGDVDGDGLGDLLIGADTSAHAAYLVLGASLGPDTEIDLADADYTFAGEDSGDHAGYSLSSAGDVDGDGLDDILIGAWGDDSAGDEAGAAYLILAASLGSSSEILLEDADHKFVGVDEYERAGHAVSSAGDVDGDGLDDILIGATMKNTGGDYAGATYLVLASSLGSDPEFDLDDADYTFTGEAEYDFSGHAVSTAGDVDGDDLDDILIGAYGEDSGGDEGGATYLVLAASLGSSTEIDLGNADYKFIGEGATADEDYFGFSVSNAGDLDGDGLGDLLVGAERDDSGGSNSGAAYIFLAASLGSSSEIAIADADYQWVGESGSDRAGYSVSGAGDVDGDGLDDVIVGAYKESTGAYHGGAAYLVLGASLGSTAANDLADADTKFLGEADYDYAGHSVSNAGDINGDGLDDLIVGAYAADNAGITYVLLAPNACE